MDQPPPKPPASEAATIPGATVPDGATLERVPVGTDGPRLVAPAVLAPPELTNHARYRVVALLGQGGMGSVYKAEHKRMERLVALKVVNPALVHDPASVQRFHQEVRAAAKLHHPHIVTAFDADQAGGLHFLVMEFVEGESLAAYLERKGPLPFAEASEYVRQVALGLQHAHERGMVHRDVKPHNLMRTPQGQIKILDFGLARLGASGDAPRPAVAPLPSGERGGAEGAESPQLTEAGVVMGTADYIAPEQAHDSHTADIRADIYSLGCTLYHLLTGRTPFSGGSALDKVMRHAADRPDALHKLRRGVPAGLAAVVLKMMAKEPARRYQTPAEVARALAAFAGRRRRRWPWVAAASAAVIAVAAVVLFFITSHKKHAAPSVPDPAELAGRPGAADALKGEPTPGAPDLVAVLGDDRLRIYGQTGFPAFRPDGKALAVPSGPDVLIFDAETGRPTRTLLGCVNRVFRVAYSPDGKTVAAASTPDRVVKLWDADTGRELDCRIPAEACGPYPAFDFGPDGTFAVIDAEGVVHLFNVAAGKQTATLPGGPKDACSVAFRPDGTALAAAARDGAVCVWDVPGRAVKKKLVLPRKASEENACVAYNPDGSLLAAGDETAVKVWDGRSFEERWSADTAGAALTAFAGDGAAPDLFTATRDCGTDRPHVVRRWRAADGADRGAVTAAGQGGFALYAVRPDGKAVAATAYSHVVLRMYDAATGKSLWPEMGHTAAVHALAYSPDGATLASGGDDGLVKTWDLATGVERLTLEGHTGAVRALAFAPDGKTLASGGADGAVRIWNLADGKTIHILSGHAGGVEDLAFSPDGKTLASCGKDHATRLWDATTGEARGEPLPSEGSVNGVAFHPDGRLLAAVGDDQTATLWDVTTRQKEGSRTAGAVLYKTAFLPDGRTLAAACDDGQIRRWDAKGAPIDALSRSAFKLTKLAVRADGGLIAAAGGDTAVRLWDPANPSRRLAFFVGPPGAQADAVAFSPEGRYLAVAGPDGSVRLFRLAAPGVVFQPPADGAMAEGRRLVGDDQPPVRGVAFEADGAHVLTCGGDNKVRRWDAETGTAAEPSKNVRRNAGPVAFLPDGRRLLSGGSDGKLRLWDFRDGKEIYAKDAAVQAIALSADGRYALTGGDDRTARLWDVEGGTVLRTLPASDKPLRCVALAAEGERLVILTPGPDSTVRLWDRTSEKPLHVFPAFAAEPAGLCISGDGARAAWGGDDGLIHVWDLKNGMEERRLPFRDGPIHAMAFSPDGGRLLAAGGTGLLSLWDVESGRVLDRTRTHPASGLAFSPDGLRAVIGCDDATASIWRMPRLP